MLYKEHLELKSESDKEKNKLTEEKEEALLSKDQNDIRLQEFEVVISSFLLKYFVFNLFIFNLCHLYTKHKISNHKTHHLNMLKFPE